MKRLITAIFLISILTSATAYSLAGTKQKIEENTVWICTGKGAKKYHSYKCSGVKKCKAEIVKVSEKKAKDMGLTKCKICYK